MPKAKSSVWRKIKVIILILVVLGGVGAYVGWYKFFREEPQPEWMTADAGDALQVRLDRRRARCRHSVLDLLRAAADVPGEAARTRRLCVARRVVGAGPGAADRLHEEGDRLSRASPTTAPSCHTRNYRSRGRTRTRCSSPPGPATR